MGKLTKLKKNNPKTKIIRLNTTAKKLMRIPIKGFIKIDDPNYEFDDLGEAILEKR